MKRITDIFAEKDRTFSCEFYPPKTEKGRRNLFEAADVFAETGADFFSVTYGAGGSESRSTLEIVSGLHARHKVAVMHHLTCVKHTFADIRNELMLMRQYGVRNIMALRGDPPNDGTEYKAGPDRPHYGFELIKIIREHGDWFSVGVPGFPEGHPMSMSLDMDSKILHIKEESGADFAITQLFFDVDLYRTFEQRVRRENVSLRLIPGILPVTNYPRLIDFCRMCGATVPDDVHETFQPLAEDSEATRQAGIEYATRQCERLLEMGAPGIHFYCLNRAEPVATILRNLGVGAETR
ncbi:MAG: methylenetetrahydrofolate reductase, partial [Phycisphaerae bacterium]